MSRHQCSRHKGEYWGEGQECRKCIGGIPDDAMKEALEKSKEYETEIRLQSKLLIKVARLLLLFAWRSLFKRVDTDTLEQALKECSTGKQALQEFIEERKDP